MSDPQSWAAIAVTQPVSPTHEETSVKIDRSTTCAVLDASAIICGNISSSTDVSYVTTPDVDAEIRDKQSRRTLEALPFGLTVLSPSEDSVAAGRAKRYFIR